MRAGQLLIDATVPLAASVGGRPTRMLGVWQGSAAQQAQELVPDGVRVVGALHTVSAAALGNLDHALDEDVLVVGDPRADKHASRRCSTESTDCAASTPAAWRWRGSPSR